MAVWPFASVAVKRIWAPSMATSLTCLLSIMVRKSLYPTSVTGVASIAGNTSAFKSIKTTMAIR